MLLLWLIETKMSCTHRLLCVVEVTHAVRVATLMRVLLTLHLHSLVWPLRVVLRSKRWIAVLRSEILLIRHLISHRGLPLVPSLVKAVLTVQLIVR